MPRYFFHTEDGQCFPDETGTELPDFKAVRRQAIVTYGEMIREMVDDVLASGSFWIIVKDEDGLTLLTFDGSLMEAPAVSQAKRA